MKPYKWQEECLKEWEKKTRIGYIEAVTGAGKTYLALFAFQHLRLLFPKTKTIIVVPRVALANQWKQIFLKNGFFSSEVAVRSGGVKDSIDKKIIIYVINTARYELARSLLEFQKENTHVLLIADEYHHYFSKENRHIFDFIYSDYFNKNLYSYLGISATRGKCVPDFPAKLAIGKLFYRYRLEDALKDKVVSPFAIYNIKINFSYEEKLTYNEVTDKISKLLNILNFKFPHIKPKSDFQEYLISIRKVASDDEKSLIDNLSFLLFQRRELIANAEQRISCTLNLFEQLKTDSKIIIFCERINQCNTLFQHLNNKFPESVSKYHSLMDKETRTRNLTAFRNNNTRILIACKALDEGIDIPSADVGIFLSNSDSELQRIQRLGRLIRRTDNKDIADLYYIYVDKTIEFPFLLRNTPSFIHSISLSYCHGKIENPAYNIALQKALKKLASEKKLNPKQIKSIYNATLQGIVHHDYLSDTSELDEKIHTASSVSDRNYYILAKAVHSFLKEPINEQRTLK